MQTRNEVVKEMRSLGYDTKGVKFTTVFDEEANPDSIVVKVYVKKSCPLSMRYFQSHNMWQEKETLFNSETVFIRQ